MPKQTTETVRIRDGRPEDARAIAEVHVASWRWGYRELLPEAKLDALSVADREAMWAGWFADPEPRAEVLVAEVDGSVVGFTGYGPSRDEDASEKAGEVRTIYLLEEAAGRGIGRDLFATAEERLRALGYEEATLWVLEANQRTRRFYEIAGWKPDGATSTERVDCANLPTVRYRVDLA